MRIVVHARFTAHKTGIGRVIEGLFTHLQHIDHENEYFIFVNEEFRDFVRFTNPRFHLVSNGVPAASVLKNHLWSQTGLLYQALRLRADLIILPGITLYFLRLAPTIYFQHDLMEYKVANQTWFRLLFRRVAFPITLRVVDRVIGVSENTLADIRERFQLPEKKLALLYNGVDRTLFRPVPREAARTRVAERYGIDGAFFLYTGTLTLPQKNLLRLVEAHHRVLRRGLHAKLVLVGARGKDADLITERVRELGREGDVVFPGYVPDEDLPYLLGAAHAFCFPSLYEGFGLPVLEAMACGCPVLTSNVSSLPEVAGDAALLVDPLRTDAIADAMARLLAEPALRDDLVRRGLVQSERFSWERSAIRFLEIIRSVGGRQ